MKKATRKGFTIVELLVVIAVIAVLAAVLIPVMITLIDDAKVSNDEQIVSSLNRAIAAETGDIDTMSDAIDAAEDYGYDVEKLSLESDSDVLVWDQDSKYFGIVTTSGEEVYSNGGLTDEDGHLWVITDGSSDTAEESGAVTLSGRTIVAYADSGTVYSSYLAEGYEGDTEFAAGVDVGRNEDLSLTVNAAYDGILVNANGGSVTVAATKAEYAVSFYGETNGITLDCGTLTVTSGSSVSSIVVTAESADDVILTLSSGASVDAVAAVEGVLTSANFVNGTSVEAEEVSADDIAIGQEFSGGVGTESNPFIIASVTDFTTLSSNSYYDEDSDAPSYACSGYCWKVTADLDLSGTTAPITLSNGDSVWILYFVGDIDFGGHTVTMPEDNVFLFGEVHSSGSVKNSSGGTVISDLDIICQVDYGVIYLVQIEKDGSVTLSNVDAYGDYATYGNGNNASPYVWGVVGYSNDSASLIYEDCTNYSNFTSTASSSAGFFLGKIHDNGYGTAKVTFDTCVNYGTLIHANGYASMLISNAASFSKGNTSDLTVTDCVNYGSILSSTGYANLVCGQSYTSGNGFDATADYGYGISNGASGVVAVTSFGTLSTTSDGYFDFSGVTTSASSYKLIFNFWAAVYEDSVATTYGSTAISVALTTLPDDLSAGSWTSTAALEDGVTTSTNSYGLTVSSEGEYVYTADDWSGEALVSNVSATLIAYDSDGSVLQVYTYTY